MNLTIIASLLASAAGFGLAWQLQYGNIASIKLEVANERIAQQRAARVVIERTTTKALQAQNDATARVRFIAAERDRLGNDADKLRQQSEAAVRAAASSLDACHAVAAAQGVILTESTSFIQELVGNADQCLSDLTLIQEAWPK